MALLAVGMVALLAQSTSPDAGDLWRLGVIAVALVVGAAITYRYVALPERSRADKEREERIAAQDREREAYKVTTPAVLASNAALDRVLQVLPRSAERSG